MHRALCFAASFFKGAAVGIDVAIDAATFSLWYDKCADRFGMHCRNNEFYRKYAVPNFKRNAWKVMHTRAGSVKCAAPKHRKS